MKVWQWVVAGVLSVVMIFVVVFGGWELGWWFKTQNTNRNTHLYQHSYGAQTADNDAFQNDLQAIAAINVQIQTPGNSVAEINALKAQRQAVMNQACVVGKRLYQPPADVLYFVKVNCP